MSTAQIFSFCRLKSTNSSTKVLKEADKNWQTACQLNAYGCSAAGIGIQGITI